MNNIEPFKSKLFKNDLDIKRDTVDILQVNIGRICNQACHHCHVESSPIRTENMSEEKIDRIIELLKSSPSVHTLDITGGAPEMNDHFKKLVVAARALNKKVIDRCNLTILFEKGHEKTAEFLRANEVQIVASLPCYSKSNVEKQRGSGVFNKSIEGLKILNSLGYGVKKELNLDLVYNPQGAYLPPDQSKLQNDYKKELKELFNIEFNNLYTITNMPIKRFYDDLERSNELDNYMLLLEDNFNIHAANGVMCKNLVSVSWDGELFDCDFNQMLELPLGLGKKTLWDIESFENGFDQKNITFANHCYACTAGSGSSCGGTIVKE